MFLLSPFVPVTASSSNCTPPLTFYDLFPSLLSFLSASITESLCLLRRGGDFFFFLNQLHMPLLWFSSHQQLVRCSPGCSSHRRFSYLSSPQSLVQPNGCKVSNIKARFELSDRAKPFQIKLLASFKRIECVMQACTFLLDASCRADHQPTILNNFIGHKLWVQSCFLSLCD